jgi:hypothetical protein
LLLDELATTTATTAVPTQHAKQIIHTDHYEKIEEANRIPVVIYDTEWKDEKLQPISDEFRSSIQNAQRKYPPKMEYEQAKIRLPKSILSRERHEQMETNNQEITQRIDTTPPHHDRLIERIESDNNNLLSNSNKFHEDKQQILCHPIDNHVQINEEQTSSLSDDSLLHRHQQQSNINFHQATSLENPLHSTTFLTLNYPHHNQEQNPSWQQAFDQQVFDQSLSRQEHLQVQTEQLSPRHLPSISSTANEQSVSYVGEFHQRPLLHENVQIHDSEQVHLLPSTQINQSRPMYRVRQQQISPNDEYDYSRISPVHSDHIDRINTAHTDSQLIDTIHIAPPPVTVGIQVRARPIQSELSSYVDMESFLNRFEDSLEPELHLPLVDQISLSYSTSIRSLNDNTERAIERYEQEHPFFSRSLPREWLQPTYSTTGRVEY